MERLPQRQNKTSNGQLRIDFHLIVLLPSRDVKGVVVCIWSKGRKSIMNLSDIYCQFIINM